MVEVQAESAMPDSCLGERPNESQAPGGVSHDVGQVS